MPELCRFFGIVIRMYFHDHAPPHLHAEYQGKVALIDFDGNVLRGGLGSRTALRLVRQWIDLHVPELVADWRLAQARQAIQRIPPLE